MIRDRLKSAARRAAVRFFGMEFDVEERDPAGRGRPDPSRYDPSKIPPLVDGDGDTPGPNHKTDIGRTWVSAQLAAGSAPFLIDVRPPAEVVAGIIPGVHLWPALHVQARTGELPAAGDRIVVVCQTGEHGSAEAAAWLRENGWPMARRLRGGMAEWIEHGERVAVPSPAAGGRLSPGHPVRTPEGREGWVLEPAGPGAVRVWHADGSASGPWSEDALRA